MLISSADAKSVRVAFATMPDCLISKNTAKRLSIFATLFCFLVINFKISLDKAYLRLNIYHLHT